MNNKSKANLLFVVISGVFICNALVAEVIGSKIFSLEKLLGYNEISFSFLGVSEISLSFTAGVLLWPIVFILTDVINEYYGKKGVKFISYLTVILILYAFIMIYMSIELPPAGFWEFTKYNGAELSLNTAFKLSLGQSLWIIIGSLVAFVVGQLLDVFVFHKIKKITGEKMIWLRANGSTFVAQLFDSFIVLYIAFGIGADWEFNTIFALCLLNYVYKCTAAVVLTPLLYLFHFLIEKYLGIKTAKSLKDKAQNG